MALLAIDCSRYFHYRLTRDRLRVKKDDRRPEGAPQGSDIFDHLKSKQEQPERIVYFALVAQHGRTAHDAVLHIPDSNQD